MGAEKVLEFNNPLIKIESNVPNDTLRIELFLSNFCNYKCWYCSPESYGNTIQWPTFDKIVKNFDHLLSYYQTHFKKNKFNLYIGGGEPSLWPDIIPFLQYFREKYNCKINLSTNGSRTLRWWEENGKYFDHVRISVHNEKANAEHISKVGDILYKNNVSVIASVLMDPNDWDECLTKVELLKQSKKKWLITLSEIIGNNVNYTDEQLTILRKRVIRHSELIYRLKVLRNKKPKYYKPNVYFKNGASKKIETHEMILNKWNKFYGWDCGVGLETIFIDKYGNIGGSCGQALYGLQEKINLYSTNFINEFTPEAKFTRCHTVSCNCQDEANATKIIPIQKI